MAVFAGQTRVLAEQRKGAEAVVKAQVFDPPRTVVTLIACLTQLSRMGVIRMAGMTLTG